MQERTERDTHTTGEIEDCVKKGGKTQRKRKRAREDTAAERYSQLLHLDTGCVGWTGPMMQAMPPGFVTLYASVMPLCGSGQYSMLPADT